MSATLQVLQRTRLLPIASFDDDPLGRLGAGSVVQTNYPQPGVAKNLFEAGSTGDAGDIYTSLDRFGRLEEVRWTNAATAWERVLYGYDRVGNRTWRDVNTPGQTELDEKYAYDGLYQVTQRQRGDLNTARTAINDPPLREEAFGYDSAGNWLSYTSKASGAITVDQRRGHNNLNQIGSLATAQGTAWDVTDNPLTSDKVEHDANGNMLLLPHGSDGDWGKAMKLTWDAWNRLVKVEKASDNTVIASYQYDGLWRRTTKKITGELRHYYYNDQWRSIEERIQKVDTTKVVEQQHFWGPHHRWEYIRRDRDANPTDANPALSEVLHAIQDAMSITALVDTSGAIKERYQYSAFGQRLCVPASGSSSTESTVAWMLGFHVEFSDAGGGGKVDTGLTNYGFRYYDPLCGRWAGRDPIGEVGGTNLQNAKRNNPTRNLDVLGLAVLSAHGGLTTGQSNPPIKIPDRAMVLQAHIKRLKPYDNKRLFLETQKLILEKIADGCCLTEEEQNWLEDVVKDFMDPLFDALEGRPNPRWKTTLDNTSYQTPYEDTAGFGDMFFIDWGGQMMDARNMALTHISQDLRRSLEKNGVGRDHVWKCVGDKVAEAEKEKFNALERLISKSGGYLSSTFDVGKFRDEMRDDVWSRTGMVYKDSGWLSNIKLSPF